MEHTTLVSAEPGNLAARAGPRPPVTTTGRVGKATLVAAMALALSLAQAPAGATPVGRHPAEIGAKVLVKTATAKKYGKILVDQKGLALYFNKSDQPSRWACTGACLVTWPPLVLPKGEVMAQLSSNISGLGTVSGPSGRQVTWHGKPLYTFSHDSPGTVKGEGVAHTWYVVQLADPAAGANWT
jgi:predicted lipoprotein with Yx(FWY)xxD motif